MIKWDNRQHAAETTLHLMECEAIDGNRSEGGILITSEGYC